MRWSSGNLGKSMAVRTLCGGERSVGKSVGGSEEKGMAWDEEEMVVGEAAMAFWVCGVNGLGENGRGFFLGMVVVGVGNEVGRAWALFFGCKGLNMMW